MPDRTRTVDEPPPLKTRFFHILLAIADHPRHGYAIMQEVLKNTDGQVRLWPTALYGSLRELEEQHLLKESTHRPDADEDDERRRYYELTPLGRKALAAETRRLEQLVARARAKGMLGKPRQA